MPVIHKTVSIRRRRERRERRMRRKRRKEASLSGKKVYQGQVISISILTKNLCEKKPANSHTDPRQYVPV